MSRHRVKAVSYDEDDYDDGYYSPDPEEQEFLEQCTTEVLNQLRAGDPSVTATRSEVQDALYHYYDDIEKSVNYLRGACFCCQRMNSSSPGWYLCCRDPTNYRITSLQARSSRNFRRSKPLLLPPRRRKGHQVSLSCDVLQSFCISFSSVVGLGPT